MKRYVIGFFALLFMMFLGSIPSHASEKASGESGQPAIVHLNGSGAPNTVLVREDEDLTIFLKADGFTEDGRPIYTSNDDAASSPAQ